MLVMLLITNIVMLLIQFTGFYIVNKLFMVQPGSVCGGDKGSFVECKIEILFFVV